MKDLIRNLSPFNNRTDMPVGVFIVKKVLAFALIYIVAAILHEALVLGAFYGLGYDPLHGEMPEGLLPEMLLYYGFAFFAVVVVLYWIFVEKDSLRALGFDGRGSEYLVGVLIAVVMLGAVIVIGIVTGAVTFTGINEHPDFAALLLYAAGFAVQGASEEILCRGFLFHSLKKKLSVPAAILISPIPFIVLHLKNTSLLESTPKFAIIGTVNLYLVSVVFTLLVEKRLNLWVACGLHSMWNFVLYCALGLTLTGNETVTSGIFNFSVNGASVFAGGEYGLEAGSAVTIVLIISTIFLTVVDKRVGEVTDNGI